MSDWPEICLSELASINIGGTPSRAIPAFWVEKPNGYPWISIADLKGKYVFDTKEHITSLGVRSSNVKLIPEQTTVMSFKLTVGRAAITAREMFCNEAIAIFQPKDERLSGRWLFHAIPGVAGSVVTDTAVKGATLNKAKMAEMKLRLPPLAEQVRIAEILDTLDTAIHETEAIIVKLKAINQGLLHDLLTRGIDANGELRPTQAEAPHLYNPSPLGWIPKDWGVRPLREVADVVDPQPDHRTPREEEDGAPYIGIGDFDDIGNVDLTSCRKVVWSALEKQERRFSLGEGDIIFGKIGTIGKPKLLPEGRYAITANVLLIQPKRKNSFLYWVICSSVFERQILDVTNTTSQPALGIETVRELLVHIPPDNESISIASRLNACSESLVSERAILKKLIRQKDGLMADLLTGRVRVTPLMTEAAYQAGST